MTNYAKPFYLRLSIEKTSRNLVSFPKYYSAS